MIELSKWPVDMEPCPACNYPGERLNPHSYDLNCTNAKCAVRTFRPSKPPGDEPDTTTHNHSTTNGRD